ncbi:hypothetical protein IT408_03075 [Candidatus Uhrbacteria bacterium]|nr:hypothetical protein [Candidatus Uhrbacteria bacterium]
MPSSIPFSCFLDERSVHIPLQKVDTSSTMRWFLERGLSPTEEACKLILNDLFIQIVADHYRESSEPSLKMLIPSLSVRSFLKKTYCWQYPDERPTVSRLRTVLRTHGYRLLRPLEVMHVLWSRPWELGLFGGAPHFSSLVALQENSVTTESLVFRFQDIQPQLSLNFRVDWDDFCSSSEFQPQTILYTKILLVPPYQMGGFFV